jgi:hypothetical protein
MRRKHASVAKDTINEDSAVMDMGVSSLSVLKRQSSI